MTEEIADVYHQLETKIQVDLEEFFSLLRHRGYTVQVVSVAGGKLDILVRITN